MSQPFIYQATKYSGTTNYSRPGRESETPMLTHQYHSPQNIKTYEPWTKNQEQQIRPPQMKNFTETNQYRPIYQ